MFKDRMRTNLSIFLVLRVYDFKSKTFIKAQTFLLIKGVEKPLRADS
jgi:hypothetical protein